MLRGKHTECINMYPAQCAYFTIHRDAPCSLETHQTGQTGGQEVRERGRSISPTGKGQVHGGKSSQIAPSHPPTHSPIRGVESTPKTGVKKLPYACPAR